MESSGTLNKMIVNESLLFKPHCGGVCKVNHSTSSWTPYVKFCSFINEVGFFHSPLHGPLENIPDVAAVHLADASSSSSSSPSSSSASNFKPLYCTHTTPNTHRCFQWSALLRDGTGQSRDKRPVLTAYLPQDGTPREESPARPRCLPRKVFFFGWKMFFKHSAYLSHFTE